MSITAADVKKLRDATGLGMMECKKALEEANGDFEAAGEIARKKFGAKMATRSDRDNSEGRVAVAVSPCGSKAAAITLRAETDFTANNDQFIEVAQSVANIAVKQDVGTVQSTDEITATVEDIKLRTGENIALGEGTVIGGEGCKVGTYVHFTGKTSALVAVKGEADEALLTQLCLHITAITPEPLGINGDDVPAELVAKEKEIAIEEAKSTGKPENIAEKIAVGKLNKYIDSVALLRQSFVADDKKQIKDILPKGTEIVAFKKLTIG